MPLLSVLISVVENVSLAMIHFHAAALPYMDFLFGNETEAQTFAESEGWETRDVSEIALKIAKMPKENGSRGRTVVFTQGADATVVACNGAVS